MSRVLVLGLSLALTFTPAVAGACAALLCAAAGAQTAPHGGHQGHHEPATASVHEHHHMGHDVTPAAPPARVRALSGHGCCATDTAFVPPVAVVTSRLDVEVAIDAAVTTSRSDVRDAAAGQYSSPPPYHSLPPQPVTALLVLRI